MNQDENHTREKIVLSALTLFAQHGIVKTSVQEVAHHAGVTRVTVYRYFPGKKELVRAAFLRVEQVFQKGLADLEQDPGANWEGVLSQIGEDLSALPSGDVFTRAGELKRIYPEVYRSIQEARVANLNGIFEHIFEIAEQRGLLRPGLDRAFVQAIYLELTINIFDNPRFKSFGLSDAELYHTMTEILEHGVFLA